ncbi:MAG: SusD/RagB family nutrient-binding outer membrane lipoprotein [Bacteroidetes bacterium]|nr:SusD/RagB family nutrient-binding outer membrane lipoprotein [Bacteroidota bacterium]
MKATRYITYVIISFLLFSCEVDYEIDPNNTEVAPTSGLFNRVQKRLMDQTHEAFNSGRQYMTWVQYWNQVNYTEEDRFQYRETSNKGYWDAIYANAQDLVDIISFNTNDATKDDMARYGENVNQIAGARIMLVYIYLQAAELWGDVPYYSYGSTNTTFQANSLKSDNPIGSPAYASEEDIYMDMLSVLADAQASIITSSTINTGDNFYGGDATQWKKFANSLRLRIANRIKGVYAGATAEITAAIAAGVFESNDDNAGVTYEKDALNGAPWYRAFVVDARTDFAPSGSFVELLQGKRGPFGVLDPRLDVYCADNLEGFKVGIPLTANNVEVNEFVYESLPGDAVLAADATEIYMEYSEVCFLMSENNGWDQTWYERGVEASMQKWNIDQAVIDAYIAVVLPAATEETVMMQKYIALYMQPMEAWSEYRRTGYPNTIVRPNVPYDYTYPTLAGDVTITYTFSPIGGLTDLPNRNKYLSNEGNINKTNRDAAAIHMGGDTQDTPLWWQN